MKFEHSMREFHGSGPATACLTSHSATHLALIGNLALLRIAADVDLIAVKSAERCRVAYREFRKLQHHYALNGAQCARISLERVKQHAHAVRELWAAVFNSS